jgi:tetratricopeptide (TPR) repeat protein
MSGLNKEQMKHDPVAESIVELIGKAKPHWKKIVVYAGITALIIIAVSNWYSSKKNLPIEAGEALASVQSPEALNEVVKKYPETFAASAALMQLGSYEAQRTNYAKAIFYFQQLVNEHQKSFLVPAANLAMAKCYVAEKKYKEAENLLKRNLLYNRDHYAALSAQMELINVLNAMGQYDAALSEIQQLEQIAGKSFYASAYSGLKEKLMRVTGVTTNLQQQAYENKSL